MKNAFLLYLKSSFRSQIFQFLSWIFDHVQKMAWWETKSQFQNLWRQNLANKQLQYTCCPISQELKKIIQLLNLVI